MHKFVPTKMWVNYVSGTVLAVAWLLFIDGAAYANYTDDSQKVTFGFYIPGFVSLISLVMVNLLDPEELKDGSAMSGDNVTTKARIWFFASMVVGIGGLISALWLGTEKWLMNDKVSSTWPGITIIMQSILTMIASFLWWIGRNRGEHSSTMMF